MTKTKRSTLKLVLIRIKPCIFSCLLIVLLSIVSVGLLLYIPILVGNAIDCIIDKGNVDFVVIGNIFVKIALCIIVTAFSQWIISILNNRVVFKVVKNLRTDAFSHIQSLPLSYLDKHQSGDIVSRIIADIDQFSDGLLMGFTQLVTGVFTIFGTLLFMIYINWAITLVVVVITPLSLFVATFIAKRTHSMFIKQSTTKGEQTALMDEAISEIKLVKAFSMEQSILNEFDEVNERLRTCSLKAIFFSSLTNPATRFVNSLVYAGVGLLGALYTISGAISVGALSCFLSYANQYTKPFNEISGVITELQNAFACVQRVFDLLASKPEVADPVSPKTPSPLLGNVTFNNVEFSYSPEKELIKNFCLSVKSGQKVAIVGPTGCGKTTLINLLMRFYEPQKGEILIDGININEMTRESLRSFLSIVLQETWLKSGTIRENILMQKPDATEQEMIAAAKSAHVDKFIRQLPNGYDTVIGEGGGSLSGGQKQLLCIARVMLNLPPILILDEATSSIDTRTEIKVQQAFAKMTEGRTSFIVAHRLSTIRTADIILVMKDGKIIEHGKHDELIKNGGFYNELYNSQFAK